MVSCLSFSFSYRSCTICFFCVSQKGALLWMIARNFMTHYLSVFIKTFDVNFILVFECIPGGLPKSTGCILQGTGLSGENAQFIICWKMSVQTENMIFYPQSDKGVCFLISKSSLSPEGTLW
ncbi:Hypothetical predicted protein [Xyrichtys novacula]|uniref:Uncharacterized protein n=1 Tax=Xyrichtys novacula TaxID=13765 RepID=A0AAV1GY53_XYRNO|nr:Hypothetical predicted protein [Xyrichtys novacula]